MFKDKGLPYLLVTHEFSAACMADGYARSTGRPGVLCVVPGPGVTNSLTGLGEALLDSSPVVAIVGDVGDGEKARPFQVHALNQVELLKPVCKCVYPVQTVAQIPGGGPAGVRRGAERRARPGRGRGAVQPVHRGARLPRARRLRCPVRRSTMPRSSVPSAFWATRKRGSASTPASAAWTIRTNSTAVAELLQAPVATSVSGKGAIRESHPLAVGWGFGPHASEVAEKVFAGDRMHPLQVRRRHAAGDRREVQRGLDRLLRQPAAEARHPRRREPGQPRPVLRTDVCVHADAGVFLGRLLACGDQLRRAAGQCPLCPHPRAEGRLRRRNWPTFRQPKCGVDPLALVGVAAPVPAGGCAAVRRRDGERAPRGRALTASRSRGRTSTRSTTRRWAGASRPRSAPSGSTTAGPSPR